MPYKGLSPDLIDFYRASPMREGVLCWYPFEPASVVLDLSDGALIDLLERRCACVVSRKVDEGDTYGAAGGLSNDRFDYIVAIDPSDMSVSALSRYRDILAPHGRLLLAWENPFALRYWSGKRATVTGQPYDTMFAQDAASGAEMRARLEKAGFIAQKWYYPLTDHWFAREIYSDTYLPDERIGQRFVPYAAGDDELRFDERPLYREVIRGGAFAFMCGAYLVEARICADDAPCVVDYAAVTAYREPAKRFATVVRADVTVHKIPLHPDGHASALRLLSNHKELKRLGVNALQMAWLGDRLVMPRMDLPTLWDYWADKLADGTLEEDDLFGHFDRIRDAIYKAAAGGKCFWEMVPANCFYDAVRDQMIFFDQEYCWEGVPPEAAVARAVLALRYSAALWAHPCARAWLERLKERYGLQREWERWESLASSTAGEVFGEGASPLNQASAHAAELSRYRQFRAAVSSLRGMGYGRPAVYGHGLRGTTLLRVLEDVGMAAVAVVDRQKGPYNTVDELSPGIVDVLVVSISGGEDVAEDLRSRVHIPVYTLEELLNGRA